MAGRGAGNQRAEGFTLMELLVALAVLGLLLVGLSQGMRLGLKAWDQQSRMVGEHDQLDSTDRALRQLFEHMDPGTGSNSSQVTGSRDSISFLTQLPSAVALITTRADATLTVDDGHRLVLRWTPHLHEVALGPPRPSSTAVLLNGVAKIELSYYQPPDSGSSGSGWREEWSGAAPPPLIKLHIAFVKGDPRHWPDLVIAPVLQPPAT